MRIGTFLLGGLVGAAAVIYLSDRQNRSMMFSAFASPGTSLGNKMGKTKSSGNSTISNVVNSAMSAMNMTNKSNNTAQHSGNESMQHTAASASTNTSTSKAGGLNQVESIVNQDPALKQTVNEILADSGKSSPTLQ